MLRRSIVVLSLLSWIVFLSACERKASESVKGEQTQKEAHGPVLAKVDGEIITLDEFEGELQSLPEYTRRQLNSVEQKKKRLDKMIEEMLLQKEAERRGLDHDEEIQRKVNRYRNRLITERLYRDVAKEHAEIDDAEVRKYYEEHKDQYTQKERIRASQILILVPPNADPKKVAEAKAKAEEVVKKARAGEDFAELAKQYSEGPTSARGGDLGYFSRGRMVPEFEEIAFSLKNVGDVSDVVKTKFGFHIIKLTDRQPEKLLTLDEVRDRIVRQLESKERREIRQSLGKDLREKATVQINEELLKGEEPEKEGEAPMSSEHNEP